MLSMLVKWYEIHKRMPLDFAIRGTKPAANLVIILTVTDRIS
jgi:hypothetical protein